MKTSILAVGTELLFGQTVNTNAAYLSEKLNLMGFDVMYHFVVGDNPARLKEKLADAFTDTDLVIMTGGLGPTQDDLTKEMVAEYMGVEMHLDERVVDDLNAIFAKRGGNMPENNMKQAYLPDGCTPFYNASGTAPGFALEKDGKVAICLPGPPREMKWLFENGVRDYLEKFMEKKMVYRVIRTIGIGESDLEMLLSQRDSEEEASAAVDEMTERVRKLAGEYIYSLENEELNEVVVRILKEKGLTIASSESCTGGMFAAAITDVAGASDVISSSYVTYSNESKIKELGVPAETIERFGVVSKETAEAMAAGTKKRSGADIAVSITGFAGPESDPGHEAGEAYIGYAVGDIRGHIEIHTSRNFRTWNRRYFTLMMLRAVYMLIR